MEDSGAKVLVGDPLISPTLEAALALYKKPLHFVMNGPSPCPTAINLWQVLDDPSISFANPSTVRIEKESLD